MLDVKTKAAVIKKFQTHKGDTGSSEVQIAILTAEIEELIGHLKAHPKDHSSRRGLLRKVSSRRQLMRYLKKENLDSYEKLMKKLKIKMARTVAKPGAAESDAAILDEEMEVEPELKEAEAAA
jgi:small subunit ribosomal protein S15